MKIKSLLTISLFTLASISITSCGTLVKLKAQKYATVEQGAIPPDFGKQSTTMLFITRGQRSYDKYLKRNVKKTYHGPYKLIKFYELSKDPYKDLNQYPFCFDFRNKSSTYTNRRNNIYGPAGASRNRTVRVFGITDRRDKQRYEIKMTSGFWSKLQQVYIKNLELERLKK